MVTTHYHGTFLDGNIFDSSVQRGQPASFPVNGVIAGWTEALQLMEVGSKWRLFIPYHLAYGEHGHGQAIPPYTTLVFEVELLEIKKWQRVGLSLERIKSILDGMADGKTTPPQIKNQSGDVAVWSHIFISNGVEQLIEPKKSGLTT